MFVFSAPIPMPRRAPHNAAGMRSFADARDNGAARAARGDAVRVPALDVVEADGSYTATLDVPGIAKEQFSVAIDGRRVDVSTTAAAQDAPGNGAQAAQRERAAPRYARSFVLPAELDAGAAQAKLANGVLTLTLPKRRAATLTVQ